MKMIPDGIRKIGAVMLISDEAMFNDLSYRNPEFTRKANVQETEPTPEAWARYYTALAGLRCLEAYEGTEWGGPDYGTEVHPPENTVHYEWLETHEEWLARCREIVKGWNE